MRISHPFQILLVFPSIRVDSLIGTQIVRSTNYPTVIVQRSEIIYKYDLY